MQVKAICGVITSQGVLHRGAVADLPEQEAAALIRMGRVVPHDDAPAMPVENREADLVVTRRGRSCKADA